MLSPLPWLRWSRQKLVMLIILVGTAVSFLPNSARSQSQFSDLSGRESQAAAIEDMATKGIIAPQSPDKFNPSGVFTRADFAVAVQKLFNLPRPTKEIYFADVPKGSPLYEAVEATAPFMDRRAPEIPGPRSPSYCRPAPGQAKQACFSHNQGFSRGQVLPDRIALFMKEKSGIAGIFRAKVDGARQKRRTQNRGRPNPEPVLRRDFGLAKSEQYHFAEESALEIEL
jgi:hypothetical protein